MQITARINPESQPMSNLFEKEEITCNQARQQKFNYQVKQLVHAYFRMPKAAAIVMQIALHFHFCYKSAFVLNVRRIEVPF